MDKPIFNEETGLWYKLGDIHNGIKALTYPEAFEKLYGYSVPFGSPVRERRSDAG